MQTSISKLISAIALIASASCHMELESPAPRRSRFNQDYVSKQNVDYDMTAPLGSSDAFTYSFPCRGDAPGPAVKKVKAGEIVSYKLGGGAPHNGGHCEISISYDNQNFVAINTIVGTCMVDGARDYQVTIPANAPSGKATFAWSWINKTGNREFYMNCADIEIEGSADGVITGPEMFVGNLPGKPVIPEFSDSVTGSEYYKDRKIISIKPSGAYPHEPVSPKPQPKPEPTQTSQPQPKPEPTQTSQPQPQPTQPTQTAYPQPQPTQTTQTAYPQPTQAPEPQPEPKPQPPNNQDGQGCEQGSQICDGENFKVCVWGTYVAMDCPGATKCQRLDTFNIACY